VVVFLLGIVALLVVMGALGAFSKAQVSTLKSLGMWMAAIGGLLLATMLLLTGRGGIAISALFLLGPLIWSWVAQAKPSVGSAPRAGPMTRQEALDILGLRAGATAADIRAAHRRLMLAAHPDHGGSDWLAARINQARDVLLG
jgi:DnaJ family protein C protein 19